MRGAPSTMTFEVGLTPSQILEAVHAHPSVRESREDYPYPPPPWGAPLLLLRSSESSVELRHYAGPLMPRSPVMRIMTRRTEQGTEVTVDFRGLPPVAAHLTGLRQAVESSDRDATLMAIFLTSLFAAGFGMFFFGILGFYVGAVSFVLLYQVAIRGADVEPEPTPLPEPQGEAIAPELFSYFGMQRYGPRFRALVGDVLVRHQLRASGETDPYRRQLGPGSDRRAA